MQVDLECGPCGCVLLRPREHQETSSFCLGDTDRCGYHGQMRVQLTNVVSTDKYGYHGQMRVQKTNMSAIR